MKDTSDAYSEAETGRRAEAALKRMLSTPHQPHNAKPAPNPRKTSRAKPKATHKS